MSMRIRLINETNGQVILVSVNEFFLSILRFGGKHMFTQATFLILETGWLKGSMKMSIYRPKRNTSDEQLLQLML